MADLERTVRTWRKKLQKVERKKRKNEEGKLGSESIARAWKWGRKRVQGIYWIGEPRRERVMA